MPDQTDVDRCDATKANGVEPALLRANPDGLSTCNTAGRVVFEGTPADLVAARSTLTGKHLAAFVKNLDM